MDFNQVIDLAIRVSYYSMETELKAKEVKQKAEELVNRALLYPKYEKRKSCNKIITLQIKRQNGIQQ